MDLHPLPSRPPTHIHETQADSLPPEVRPWRLWFFGLTLVACGGLLALSFVARTAPADSTGGPTVFSALTRLIGGGDGGVAGAEDDRINLLLLGVGGAGHDGPELSDTILLSSFRPSTGEVGMISVPRDLLVNIPGYGLRKVNHVNAYAENENTGSGPAKTADFIGQLFEEDIQYAVKVDFRGFAEIIDAVGGVDIYIERSFSDPTYPIDGMEDALCGVTSVPADSLTLSTGETEVESAPGYNCRYESLTFNEG